MRRLSRNDLYCLGTTLGLTLAGVGLLELWRPFYFLTDDNLSNLSFLVQMGQRLSQGQYPFVNEAVFGGYDWLRDPALMHFTHPLVLALSLLALTPLQAALMEVLCGLHLLTAAAAFFFLARLIRQRFQPELKPGWLVFLSLSYTFCAYNLIIGASWSMYMANLAAIPLVVLGLLHPERRWGVTWTALGVVNAALLGHVGPLLLGGIFLTGFALLAARALRTWRPLQNWLLGGSVAMAVTSPIWLTALTGFSGSERAGSLAVEHAALGAYPFLLTLASTFLGTGSLIFEFLFAKLFAKLFALDYRHAYALAGFAAAWLILPALMPAKTITPPALRLSRGAMLTAFLAALFVARPVWLAELLQHLPVLRSLRWPFKELIYVVFFLHLWLLLRPWRGGPRLQVGLAAVGTAVLLFSLLSAEGRAPALSDRSQIRDWYLSGAAGRYWRQMQPRLPPDRLIVPVVSPAFEGSPWKSPSLLVASGNYGGLFPGVRSAYGYSPTAASDQRPHPAPPHEDRNLGLQAIFATDTLTDDWLCRHPELVVMELLQADPVKVRILYGKETRVHEQTYQVSPQGDLQPESSEIRPPPRSFASPGDGDNL